jgi:hypothetical protein
MRQILRDARKPLAETEDSAELHPIIVAADLNAVAGPKIVAVLKDNSSEPLNDLNPVWPLAKTGFFLSLIKGFWE